MVVYMLTCRDEKLLPAGFGYGEQKPETRQKGLGDDSSL